MSEVLREVNEVSPEVVQRFVNFVEDHVQEPGVQQAVPNLTRFFTVEPDETDIIPISQVVFQRIGGVHRGVFLELETENNRFVEVASLWFDDHRAEFSLRTTQGEGSVHDDFVTSIVDKLEALERDEKMRPE